MSKFNFDALRNDIKKQAPKDIENQIKERIKQKFPEITEYSVHVDLVSGQVTIMGLTPEQVEQVK